MKRYAVPVRETFERVAYVDAATPTEARRKALDPTNWVDSDDPEGAGEISSHPFPVIEERPPPPSPLRGRSADQCGQESREAERRYETHLESLKDHGP